MKKVLVILLLLNVCYIGNAQTNSNKVSSNVFKKVILIDAVPTEVLMNWNGDILAKLNILPDYLKGFEIEDSIIDISNVQVDVFSNEERKLREEVALDKNYSLDNSSNFEIKFKGGTAYIDPLQIQVLNDLISQLNSGRINALKLFGFVNEPDYRSQILSQRRIEAILAYMAVKGIDIDDKIIVGDSVNGRNNKIVFVETD